MTTQPHLRLAIAATPALLADSLASLVPSGVDVTLLTDPTTERFHVAIVTADAFDVDAEIVIVLDDEPATLGGGHLTVRGRPVRHLPTLADVLEAVGSLPHPGHRTGAW